LSKGFSLRANQKRDSSVLQVLQDKLKSGWRVIGIDQNHYDFMLIPNTRNNITFSLQTPTATINFEPNFNSFDNKKRHQKS
jgi:hypothetical protein